MTVFCYQHHINDWRRDTGDLSLEERGAYRELLDWYYLTEGRMPADIQKLCRMLAVQTDSERTAIASAVKRFFHENPDGTLSQSRADRELERIKDRSFKASTSAKHRYNKDIRSANAEHPHSNGTADTMLTNNHKPITSSSRHPKVNGKAKGSGLVPEILEGEILPPAWQDYAEDKGLSFDRTFETWPRFKEHYQLPWAEERWRAWVDREFR